MSHNWTCHYVNLTCLLMSLYNIICYITEYDVTTILSHLFVALSSFSPTSVISLSIVGLAVLFCLSLLCPHLAFFSLCAPLSLSSHGRRLPLQLFFCNFLGRLHHSCCPFNVFISDLTTHCHSAHPSQHPHLNSSHASCPFVVAHAGFCTIQQSWSDHSFVNLSLCLVNYCLAL